MVNSSDKTARATALFTTLIMCFLFFKAADFSANTSHWPNDHKQIVSVPMEQTKKFQIIQTAEASIPKKEIKINDRDLTCMTRNLFYEARGTSEAELTRVANVVLNRKKSNKYPSDICSIIYQPYQFSWTLDTVKANTPISELYSHSPSEMKAFERAKQIAIKALKDELPDLTQGAMWYHTHAVYPRWRFKKDVSVESSWHKFYVASR